MYRQSRQSGSWRPTFLQVLIVLFILPLIGSAVLVQYLAWRNGQQAIEQLVEQLQQQVGDRIQDRLIDLTEAPEAATASLALAIHRGDLDPDNLSAWESYLTDQGIFFDGLTFLYFGNQQGDYVELYQEGNSLDQILLRDGNQPETVVQFYVSQQGRTFRTKTTEPFDPRRRPWYQSAINAREPRWTEPYEFILTGIRSERYGRGPSTTGISFVRPYYADSSAQNEEALVGVIGADLTLLDIDKFLSRLEIGDSGEAFIFNRTGQILASSTNQAVEPSTDVDSLLGGDVASRKLVESTRDFLLSSSVDLEDIARSQTLRFENEGNKNILQVMPCMDRYGLNWFVAVVVPESDFVGTIRDSARQTLLLSTGILVGMLCLTVLIAQCISRSVLRISSASQAIAKGDLAHRISGFNIRELDLTAKAFNNMAHQLRNSYSQLENHSRSLESKVKKRTQELEQEVRDRTRSEATFRTLVSNIPGTVYRCYLDKTWTMAFISEAVFDLCGYPASDFIDNRVRSFTDIILPVDVDIEAAVKAAIEQRQPYTIEYRIVHADGSIRWVYSKGRGTFNENGLLYLDGVIFDITPLKKAEAAIRTSEQRYRSLFEDAPIGLWEENFSEVNRYLKEIGVLSSPPTSAPTSDPTTGPIAGSVTGSTTGPTTGLSDQTSSFRDYFDRHPQVIRQCISRIQILRANQAALNLFEFDEECDLSAILACNQQAAAVEDLKQEIISLCEGRNTHESEVVRYTLTGKARHLIFKNFIAPGHEQDWGRVIVSTIDISWRKQAESDLIQAKQKAEVANQAKSQFLAKMNHELRSPLNAILGFAQIMARSRTLPAEHHESVSIINRSGEFLLSLINNVLDMAKIEAGHTVFSSSAFDIHTLLDDLYDLFRLKAEEQQIQLIVHKSPDLPQHIHTDRAKLCQVLINLIDNAIKFTHVGSVTLTVQSATPSPSPSFPYPLTFSVADTGTGIDSAELDCLFQPFVQTQSGLTAQSGTGLGLAICRKFVQMMGGEISVASQIDQGTTISFSIRPAAIATTPLSQTRPTKEQRVLSLASDQPRYRLLIVDDEAVNRQLLFRLLEPVGFELQAANSGNAAIEMTQRWQPDMILMDLRMPAIDGIEAIRQIRRLDQADLPPDLISEEREGRESQRKIVALSASSVRSEEKRAIAAGCDGFIRKPFKDNDIFRAIAQHLGARYTYAEAPPLEAASHRKLSAKESSGQVLSTREAHSTVGQSITALAALPNYILETLESAVLRLQWDEIIAQIDAIRTLDEGLANSLSRTVNSFQYSQIIEHIRAVKAASADSDIS